MNNRAAWLDKKQTRLEVREAPYTKPKDNQIVVRNYAISINPLDWILQQTGNSLFRWIKLPFVLGADTAGEVVEIGKSVKRFKIGDRVMGHAVGSDKDCNTSAEGTFQIYSVLLENMSSPIPVNMSYEEAAVLPLALSTAACGLFQKDYLALNYPGFNIKPTGKTVLIWGGSTSVGSNAIQLAVAAGYEVITTCSAKNFNYVKSLGASQAFDYHSKTVVRDLISAFKNKQLAGALAIGKGSSDLCLDVVHKCNGDKFISTFSTPVTFENGVKPHLLVKMGATMASFQIKSRSRKIKTKGVFGSSLKLNEVSKAIYEDFMPRALKEGTYKIAPEPQIIGKGLEQITKGLDIQRKGVSAKKIVISL